MTTLGYACLNPFPIIANMTNRFAGLFLCLILLTIPNIRGVRANVLEDLLTAAMKYDNQLLLAEAQLNEAKSRARGAAGQMAPQVTARVQSNRQDGKCSGDFCSQSPTSGERDGTATTLSLTQSIYEPAVHSTFRRDRARAEQRGYLYAAARLAVFQRLLSQYIDILKETDRLRTLRSQRETVSKQAERVAALVANGARRRTDLTEALAAKDLNAARIFQSEITLQTFYEGLSEATKLSIKNLPPIRKDVKLPKLEPANAAHWKREALEQNFNLRAARKGVDAARFEVRRLSYGPAPKLNIYADYTESSLNLEAGNQNQRQTEVGIRLSLPIYEGGLYADIRAAKSQKRQAEQQLLLAELEVKTLVPSLVRLINRGQETVDAAFQNMRAKEENARQTSLEYRDGAASITEFLESYDNFYQAERDYYESLYAHIMNYADFYVRTGTLNEKTVRPFYDIADFTDYDPENPVYPETN